MQVGDLFHGWNHWYNDTICRWCPVVSSHQLSSTLCKLHRMILVGNWSCTNYLTFDRDKCKYMIVSCRKIVSTHHHHFHLKAILWNRWKCSSIWVISLGVNMLNAVVRLERSLAFSTEDSTITLRVVLLYFNSTSPSLGPNLIMTHLVPLAKQGQNWTWER